MVYTCKYGPRLANGKCPKKLAKDVVHSKKKRSCKYGARLANGKCPKKPTTQKNNKTKKMKSFSPPRPPHTKKMNTTTTSTSTSTFIAPIAPQTATKMDIELIMYENDKQVDFMECSGQEQRAIENQLMHMLDVYDIDINLDEVGIIKNVEFKKNKVNEKYDLDKKYRVKLPQYGVNKWGTVDFEFRI